MAGTDIDRPDIDPSTDPLWQRLETFDLDAVDSELTFSGRLARENGWKPDFARRVIEEYKRFCYLAVRAGHDVTPSDQVDQVWHLHLTYSRNYWDEFCGKVLQCDLHHDPTRGGMAEAAKYRDWYKATRESYERLSGEKPPADIWPLPMARFDNVDAMRRVDTADNFVIRKPSRGVLWLALVIAIVAAVFAFANDATALGWMLIAAAIAIGIFRRRMENRIRQKRREHDDNGRGGFGAACGGGCGGCGGG